MKWFVPRDRLESQSGDCALDLGRLNVMVKNVVVTRLDAIVRGTVDHDERRACAHRREERLHDSLGHRELVKRVRHERGIDGPCQQVRVIGVTEDDVQIPVAAEESANPQERERLPAEIDGEDVPFWRNARRHFQCEVSGPGSEIDDCESRAKVQPLQNLFRPLPGVSLLFDSLERVQRFDRLLRHEESWHDDQYQNEGDGPPRRHASDSPIRESILLVMYD